MNEKVWSVSGMTLTGKTEVLGRKPVSVPLCPPNATWKAWDLTHVSVVKDWQLPEIWHG
jgi:hypothetical protein